MLHIILLLLKFIGILLLIVFGILLFLLLIIAFVPLRYRLTAQKGLTFDGKVQVTWLLHLLSIQCIFEKGKLSFSLKILGKVLLGEQDQKSEQTKKSAKKSPASLPAKEKQQTNNYIPKAIQKMPEPESIQETTKPEPIQEIIEPQPIQETKTSETIEEITVPSKNRKHPDSEHPEPEAKKKKANPIRQMIFRFKQLFAQLKSIILNIKDKVIHLSKTIEHIKISIRKYTDFWHLQRTQNAYKHLKKELFYIIKHVIPRKADGYLHFGFDDPATTGEVLGILYFITMFWPDSLSFEPDFEQKILNGKIQIDGHVRICHFIKVILSLILDQNVRNTFFAFRKLRSEPE